MLTKVRDFWRMPVLGKLHYLSYLYYRLKGVLLYRALFQEFGAGSYIRKPLLISNARFIRIGRNVAVREGVRLEVIESISARVPLLSVGDNVNLEQNVHIVCHNRIRI